MSKRGKVLHSGERNLLYKIMTFFEQEKVEKQLITPYDVHDVVAMKSIGRLKNENSRDTCGSTLLTQPDAPSEIEIKLLENEKKYQALLKSFDNVIKRTAAATGISERTLTVSTQLKRKFLRCARY
ncbi:unnamed protein product [Parnassius apollo]|uniref:(apollo) hypothetical protein n=1 Tax=Parnassius apollo TaxID=110799 RepID=A0A8S3W9K6_PARAO|nr:unnamed protein product [Parnassius apollo]